MQEIDNFLSKMVDYYKRLYPSRSTKEKRTNLNDIEYIFNLLEDAHFFINKGLSEVTLFEFKCLNTDYKNIQSPIFFINNSIMSTLCSWERIVALISIIYKIELDDDIRKNTIKQNLKKIRKNAPTNSQLIKKIDKIRQKGLFFEIDSKRKENDHDISMHLKYITNNKLDYNSQKDYLDYLLKFKNIADDILENIEVLYSLMKDIIFTINDFVKDKEHTLVVSNKLKVDHKGILKEIEKVRCDPKKLEDLIEVNKQISQLIVSLDENPNKKIKLIKSYKMKWCLVINLLTYFT